MNEKKERKRKSAATHSEKCVGLSAPSADVTHQKFLSSSLFALFTAVLYVYGPCHIPQHSSRHSNTWRVIMHTCVIRLNSEPVCHVVILRRASKSRGRPRHTTGAPSNPPLARGSRFFLHSRPSRVTSLRRGIKQHLMNF